MTLLVSRMTGNTQARYQSGSEQEDSGTVAGFDVTESGTLTQEFTVSLQPGDIQSYDVTVKNDSDVDITYTITAENNYKNLPLELEVVNEANENIQSEPQKITAKDPTTHKYQLQINWPSDQNDPFYAGKADLLTVKLEAVQED